VNIHIALYKWRADTPPADIRQALQNVEALAAKVPGIVEISTTENGSKYNEGYTHVILVRGTSQAAIDAYRVHPDHIKVAQKIDAMEGHGIGVDFETN
jgi:carbon monoxide dehydrogenase subunit G